MKMEYFDPKAETRLETYADTVVVEKEGSTSYIAAVRFGGYPESVKGMSDAIYGGGSATVDIDGNSTRKGSITDLPRMAWIWKTVFRLSQDYSQTIVFRIVWNRSRIR